MTPNDVLQRNARQKFSEHVQSIAFNLTLSRRMIGLLEIARDRQWMFGDGIRSVDSYNRPADDKAKARNEKVEKVIATSTGSFNSIILMRSLENRGLIYHPDKVNKENIWAHENYSVPQIALTRAGELVCDLLVEAGLMQQPIKRLSRSKRAA